MNEMVGFASYLNARNKKQHAFQWEMLWVELFKVECIMRVRENLALWTL